MRVLVCGNRGNMGRRYTAILNYLGVENIGVDNGDLTPHPDTYDRAIIATPSDIHMYVCEMMANLHKPFLCEKPIDKDPAKIQKLIDLCKKKRVDGRMVCNWAFTGRLKFYPGENQVQYSNYNTGKDGLAWDCIQLIYLAKGFPELSTGSPYLQAHIDGDRVHEGHIARSYKTMIDVWLQGGDDLWSLEDAKKATEKTIKYMEAHK